MSRRLEDISLEELWDLFPIVLTPHDPRWAAWAREEIATLEHVLSGFSPIINHIGSTAIPDIQAKPIVDLLVEIDSCHCWQSVKDALLSAGYICMSESDTRMSFNKGYTIHGYAERVFHVHVRSSGDNDEILFRDYLISHPSAAKEYERLKLGLLPKFRTNRDAYTEAKTAFVKKILIFARK